MSNLLEQLRGDYMSRMTGQADRALTERPPIFTDNLRHYGSEVGHTDARLSASPVGSMFDIGQRKIQDMAMAAGMDEHQARKLAARIIGDDANLGLADVMPGTWWAKAFDRAGKAIAAGNYGEGALQASVGALGVGGRPLMQAIGAGARRVAPGAFKPFAPDPRISLSLGGRSPAEIDAMMAGMRGAEAAPGEAAAGRAALPAPLPKPPPPAINFGALAKRPPGPVVPPAGAAADLPFEIPPYVAPEGEINWGKPPVQEADWLNVPMDEGSQWTRAVEGGFDMAPEARLYHGSPEGGWKSFKTEDDVRKERGGLVAFGAKDPAFSSDFAENLTYPGGGATVYPLVNRAENVFDPKDDAWLAEVFWEETGGIKGRDDQANILDSINKDPEGELTLSDFQQAVDQYEWTAIEQVDFARWLNQVQGFDAVKMKEGGVDTMGFFNPEHLRSPHARFDPLKRDSADLNAYRRPAPGEPFPTPAQTDALVRGIEDQAIDIGYHRGNFGNKGERSRVVHGTLAESLEGIRKYGLEPRVGRNVEEAYGSDAGLAEGEFDPDIGYGHTEAVYLASDLEPRRAFSAIRNQVASKLGKQASQVTRADVEAHGALVVGEGDDAYRLLEDGRFETSTGDITYLDDYPAALEPGDLFSTEGISPTGLMKGRRLTRYIENKGGGEDAWPGEPGAQAMARPKTPGDLEARTARLVEGIVKNSPLRKWFGESKVVDDSGDPLVLYHGSRDDVGYFDLDHANRKDAGWLGRGVYLTTDPQLAGMYSKLKGGAAAPNVMPLYAKLENPYYATLDDKHRFQMITNAKGREAGKAAAEAWTRELQAKGHDGVILQYKAKDVGAANVSREIVVFDPKGVKSAIGNRGSYRSDSDFLTDRAAPVGEELGPLATELTKPKPQPMARPAAPGGLEEKTGRLVGALLKVEAGGISPKADRMLEGTKVVDDAGKPVAVYHATGEGFDRAFGGTHFGTLKAAHERLADLQSHDQWDKGRGWQGQPSAWNVHKARLAIKNPLEITDEEASNIDTFVRAIERGKYPGLEYFVAMRQGPQRAAAYAGYDGFRYINKVEDKGSTSWIPFDSHQIISAITQPMARPTKRRPPIPPHLRLSNSENASSLGSVNYNPKHVKPTERRKVEDIAREVNAKTLKATGGVLRDGKSIAKIIANEAFQALQQAKNAAQWYGDKIRAMHHIAALEFPELLNNRIAKGKFNFIMAIMSNGTKVSENASLGWKGYDEYKRTGKMPAKGSGKEKNAQEFAFRLWDRLAVTMGEGPLLNFINTKYQVSAINKMGLGKQVSGEHPDEWVYGGAIFGPKVGGAFLVNLEGKMDSLTMDRWLMRTIGRVRGDLVQPKSAALEEKHRRRFNKALTKTNVERYGYTLEMVRGKDNVHVLKELSDKVYDEYSKGGFKNRTEFKKASQRVSEDKSLLAQPRGPADRRAIRAIFADVVALLNQAGVKSTLADAQATVWYPEQEFYGRMGAPNKSQVDFELVFRQFAIARGIPEAQINAAISRSRGRQPGAKRPKQARGNRPGRPSPRRPARP